MRIYLAFLLTFFVALSGVTQEPNVKPRTLEFDVVPSDAVIAITIRDLSDLKRRIIALSKQTDAQLASMLTIGASMGPSIIRDHLGFGQSLDESGSAAFVGFGAENAFALIMPITSTADAANAFNVNQQDLAAGKLIRNPKHDWIGADVWLGAKGKYLVMGHQDAVAKTLKAGGLSKRLDKETQAIFAADDLFVTLDFAKIRELVEAGEIQPNRVSRLLPIDLGLAIEGEHNRACFGLSVEHGFDGTFLLDFEGAESRKVLTKLQNQSNKSNLNGLPTGRIIVAISRSSGPESGELIREAAESSDLGYLTGIRGLIAPLHVAGLTGILDDGLSRIPISRAALYRNEDAERSGAFCMISILDADDAKEFIKEIRELVPIFNASLYPDRDLDDQINEQAIAKMVSFLAHENRRARDFMTAKLRLVGRHALSPLREAAKSDDPQVRSRAEQLIRDIESDLSTERAKFLSGRITSGLQPNFGYIADFERRDGQVVDAIRMDLTEQDQTVTPKLRTLLGPDWNKVRLTIVNDQLVVMLGSNTSMLDETIKNLRSGSLGVEAEHHYSEFRRQLPGELMSELHFSMADAVALTGKSNANDDAPADNGTTSMGLSVSPQQVRFDFFIPVAELNALKKLWD